MDEKERTALRAKTDTRPPDFLSDVKEYDGRVTKQQWKRENQNDGKVHEKRKKVYHDIHGEETTGPLGPDGEILKSAVAKEISRRTAGKSPRRPPATKSIRH